MIFWYNAYPENGTNQATAPISEGTHWNSKLRHGQQVFVKPGDTRFTTRWKTSIIANIPRENAVEVEGISRQYPHNIHAGLR
ncbi:hypothetical protein GJ496_007166 [Pomphorhynchus laevis]|nr:hypothetical protein GJ496_007166 [Pomphorhynchus laevis]